MVMAPLFDHPTAPDVLPDLERTVPVAPVESARVRRKRERRERFRAEHDVHVEPEDALAALASWQPEHVAEGYPAPELPPDLEPMAELELMPEPEPMPEFDLEPEPEPQLRRAAEPDPYEQIDFAAAGTPDAGVPDMNIDMSGPEF